ncbi:MAG: hypothetical protein OXH65_02880 [Paracoccaceae bacterium]|nr:hypothetical protein [Paracoccaceae bacterium]
MTVRGRNRRAVPGTVNDANARSHGLFQIPGMICNDLCSGVNLGVVSDRDTAVQQCPCQKYR